MKSSTKLLIFVLCITMCMAFLSGCDPKPAATATPSPSVSAAATEKSIFMKTGDTYRYLVWDFKTETQYIDGTGIRSDAIRQRYQDMKEKYGIDIKFIVPDANWYSSVPASAYAGTPVTDVFHAGGPFLMYGFYNYDGIAASAILPLDAYPDAATFSDSEYWNTEVQEANCYYDGKLFFVLPNDCGWDYCSLNQATFFNKNLVESKGFKSEDLYKWSKEGSWTWDKMEQIAIATTDSSTGTYGLLAGENISIMFSLIAGNGGDYITKREVDGVMKDRFVGAEEKAIKAWDFFVKLSADDKVVLQYNGNSEINDFSSGKVAMMLSCINRLEKIRPLIEDFEYGLIMPVKGPDATDYVSDMNWFGPLCMLKDIPNPKGTVQFMEMFFKPIYAKSSQENIDLLRVEVAPLLCDEESIETCVEVVKKTSPKSYLKYVSVWERNYLWESNAISKMINKEQTPKQYFESVEDLINAGIDKCYSSNTNTGS